MSNCDIIWFNRNAATVTCQSSFLECFHVQLKVKANANKFNIGFDTTP